MQTGATNEKELLAALRQMYEERLPFNRVLGLGVRRLTPETIAVEFDMKTELIGNYVQETLHGGVISASLDATGGLLASASIVPKLIGKSVETVTDRFARLGTIDLRIDYLRPGRGQRFTATGSILRSGRKVAVTRMELANENDLLIAVGTGTCIVG